ncbi:hypothetical protein LDENG_00080810 [Lucifuga dentata]|nr:hypothetical protein LDENG_00080810 [Lucifuga dentata]
MNHSLFKASKPGRTASSSSSTTHLPQLLTASDAQHCPLWLAVKDFICRSCFWRTTVKVYKNSHPHQHPKPKSKAKGHRFGFILSQHHAVNFTPENE